MNRDIIFTRIKKGKEVKIDSYQRFCGIANWLRMKGIETKIVTIRRITKGQRKVGKSITIKRVIK